MEHKKTDPFDPPPVFPEKWACDWGEDRKGYWMAFRVKTVRHALRWIPPGRFRMGSPESEPQRDDDEVQHEVILTQGFWMGETACTQALWEAVMGDNPSRFKGPDGPVENVSWEDCIKFCERINQLVPGLDIRLPTEAQWEYACRAGTETPFSFGDNITTDQVNYHGEYPYNKGSKGEYRKQTVDVGSLPSNDWGLYEIHGNVLEWCADWYGAYPANAVTDPEGPEAGDDRVLRGGSWFYLGGLCRSAFRNKSGPSYRGDSVGFRLSRGQTSNK